MKSIKTASERVRNLIGEKSRLTGKLPKFVRNPLAQKWIIALCLCLVLSLLLIPRIHLGRPDFKVDMIAAGDVKADRSFLVEDRLATEQKKIDALADARSVYDFDSDMRARLEIGLRKAFLSAEESYLLQVSDSGSGALSPAAGKPALSQLKADLEKNLGIALTSGEFETFRRHEFSPAITGKITRLIADATDSVWITHGTIPKQDMERGIITRDLKTLIEREMKDFPPIRHMDEMETLLKKKAGQHLRGVSPDIRMAALSLAKKMIRPNLTFNQNATDLKRQAILAGAKPVYYHVQSGEMIIREGEKINRGHLDKLEALYNERGAKRFSDIFHFLGMFLTILFLAVLLYLLSRNWMKKSADINIDLLFVGIVSILQILIVKSAIFISEAVNRAFPYIPADTCLYAIPFATGTMIVGVMINRNMALIFSIFSAFLISFLFDNKVAMPLFSLLGSMTACYHIVHCRKRTAFFKAGLFLGFVNMVVILALALLNGAIASTDTLIELGMGFFGGILTGTVVAGITPILETLFRYTTDIKLLELANLNQPIFQRMVIEAPGTYHHSIIVGSMVEAAAEAIGANPLLVKVSAYYHDIGKIKKPQYFIENQINGENRHDKLSPRMSALVIISHIKEGCELAKQSKLGAEIVNIIREHHGNSLVRYFYDKAKKDDDASIRALPESDFRYPGPKPQTREAGLVLLGDVIEASSRTLTNPTPSRIRNLVRERIERVFLDGQLDECELTLHDLNNISEAFIRILTGIFHQRIDYPSAPVQPLNVRSIRIYENAHRKPAETRKA